MPRHATLPNLPQTHRQPARDALPILPMTTNAPAPESKITSMPVPHDDPASDWFFQNLASKIFPGTPFSEVVRIRHSEPYRLVPAQPKVSFESLTSNQSFQDSRLTPTQLSATSSN